MNEEQMQHYSQIVAKCWADAEFKARLMADPRTALEAEGIAIPEGIELCIVENTPAVLHFVLPTQPDEGELTEQDLSPVQAGRCSHGGPCGG